MSVIIKHLSKYIFWQTYSYIYLYGNRENIFLAFNFDVKNEFKKDHWLIEDEYHYYIYSCRIFIVRLNCILKKKKTLWSHKIYVRVIFNTSSNILSLINSYHAKISHSYLKDKNIIHLYFDVLFSILAKIYWNPIKIYFFL